MNEKLKDLHRLANRGMIASMMHEDLIVLWVKMEAAGLPIPEARIAELWERYCGKS